MSSLPQRPERDFEAVRLDLENVIALLKINSHPKMRVRLLRELRLLLREADDLIAADVV